MISDDRLRVLANGASYGDWRYDTDRGDVLGGRTCVAEVVRSCDGEFIGAATPDVVVALLDRLRPENAERETQRRIVAGLYYRAGIYIHLSGYPDKGWALRDAALSAEAAIQPGRT